MWPWDRSTAEDRERVAKLAAHLRPAVDPTPEQVRNCGDARREWPLNVVPARDPERYDNRRPGRFGYPGWAR